MQNITAGTKLPVFRFKHKNNVCKEHFLKNNPSAAIIRQTYTKVLTAYREINRRWIFNCSNTKLFLNVANRSLKDKQLQINTGDPLH